MTVLNQFPMVSQLADTGEINAQFDCVPTAIAACLRYLTGKPYDGGAIKDAVYGKGYQGGTAASAYVAYCKAQGVSLYALDGTPAQLVADIRSHVQDDIPLIGTEPDPYANPALGWSHVVAFYGCDNPAGTLTVLDPYGGHSVTLTDSEWEKRLEFHQVWALSLTETRGTPEGWHDDPVTDVLTAPNGVKVTQGFRAWVLSHHWPPDNWPLDEAHAEAQLEISNPALGGGTQQVFRACVLEWTEARGVFEMWAGVELMKVRPAYGALKQAAADYSALQAKYTALQAAQPDSALQTQLDAANQKIAQYEAWVNAGAAWIHAGGSL